MALRSWAFYLPQIFQTRCWRSQLLQTPRSVDKKLVKVQPNKVGNFKTLIAMLQPNRKTFSPTPTTTSRGQVGSLHFYPQQSVTRHPPHPSSAWGQRAEQKPERPSLPVLLLGGSGHLAQSQDFHHRSAVTRPLSTVGVEAPGEQRT